jgi:hypothetical protein
MRAAALLLLLAGCASLDAESCRSADWYRVGFRDAMYGLQRQDYSYEARCAAHGTTVDEPRYAQGWREGKYEFDRRTSQSQD